MPTGSVYDTVANVVNDVSIELGLGSVSDVYASTDANIVQMRQLLRSVGRDLMLLHPWRQLIKEFTLVTTSASAYNLPLDFSGVCEQSEWDRTNRWPVGGPLSPQEWQYVKAQLPNQTLNTLFFRVFDTTLEVWPQPPPTGRTVALEYVSRYWVKTSGQTSPDKDAPTANTDTLMFDAQLVTRALKLAWQKAKSLDTTSTQGDYDATLALVTNANSAAGQVLPLWTRRRRFWGWMLGLAMFSAGADDSAWYGAALGTASGANSLAFDVQPSNINLGLATDFSPVVQVSVRDANNNLVTVPNYPITLTCAGTLTGTVTRYTLNGVATFTGLGVSSTGAGLTLTATSGLLSVVSAAFTVTNSFLRFSTQPTNASAQPTACPSFAVSMYDDAGNVFTTASGTCTISVLGNGYFTTPTAGTTATFSSGVATFTGLKLQHFGTTVRLRATFANMTADSGTFNVTAGSLDHQAWVVTPPTTMERNVQAHQFTASHKEISAGLYDIDGNLRGEGTITFFLYRHAGSYSVITNFGGVATSHGVAEIAIATSQSNSNTYAIGTTDLAGPDFVFSDAGHISVDAFQKSEFNWTEAIAGFGAYLLNADGSAHAVAGIPIAASGATISGTTTQNTLGDGHSSFSDIAGAATADAATQAIAFTGNSQTGSSAGFAFYRTQLQFDVQPGDVSSGANFSPDVKVSLRGSNNQLITATATVAVTIAISSGSTLGGTVTRNINSGSSSVTFTSVSASTANNHAQLTATASLCKSATSNVFRVT